MLGGGDVRYFRVGEKPFLWTWDDELIKDGGQACSSRLEAYTQARATADASGASLELRSKDGEGDHLVRVLAPEGTRSRVADLAG